MKTFLVTNTIVLSNNNNNKIGKRFRTISKNTMDIRRQRRRHQDRPSELWRGLRNYGHPNANETTPLP